MPYKNKKKEMKNRKKYYSKNKIKILQNKKEYYSKNKTKIKEYREKYSFNRNKKCDICKKRIHYKSKFCHSCANRISHQEEKNPMWKGDDVGIGALHEWIKRRKPKPKLCEDCKKRKPYDLANISGKYKRDVNDYKWVCRSCHMKEDKRINNLKQFKGEKYGKCN